jgi:hypothetical protein
LSLKIDTFYILIDYSARFSFIFIIFFTERAEYKLTNKFVLKTFIIAGILLGFLGLCQFLQKSPILPTISKDDYFQVFSFQLPENVRAFSLFKAPLHYGFFMILCSMICLHCFLFCHKSYYLFLFICFSFLCYISLTRNVFLCYVTALVFMLFLIRRKFDTFRMLYPLLILIIGIICFLIYNEEIISFAFQIESTITNVSSLKTRLSAWSEIFKLFHFNTGHLLFGSGISQNANAKNRMLVDNDYYALILQIGLIGSIIYFAIIWRIWNYLNKTIHLNDIRVPIMSVFSTYFLYGLFNVAEVHIIYVAIITLLPSIYTRK